MRIMESVEKKVETFAMMFGKEGGAKKLDEVASTTGTEHSNG